MAVRLNVVMVHSPPPTASAQHLGESVVGELIGLPGIDLTLVGALSSLPESSTDCLTLESIDGDVVVLDWQTPTDTLQALHAIGFAGQRSRHAHDPEATALVEGRRVYAFDLSQFDDAGDVCSALTRLKASREVRTFTLGDSAGPTDRQIASQGLSADKKSLNAQLKNSPTPAGGAAQAPEPKAEQTLNLDDLVDELDRLDP